MPNNTAKVDHHNMPNVNPNFTINLHDIFEYKFKDNTIPATFEVINVQTKIYPHIITLKNLATGKVELHAPEQIQEFYIKKNLSIS